MHHCGGRGGPTCNPDHSKEDEEEEQKLRVNQARLVDDVYSLVEEGAGEVALPSPAARNTASASEHLHC